MQLIITVMIVNIFNLLLILMVMVRMRMTAWIDDDDDDAIIMIIYAPGKIATFNLLHKL